MIGKVATGSYAAVAGHVGSKGGPHGQRRRQGQRTLLAVAGLGWLAYKALQWGRQENLYGQMVLITGAHED
jgi:hypothetical protein